MVQSQVDGSIAAESAGPQQGRTAVVTGAGRGLGRAAAQRLAAEGASMILVGRGGEALDAVVDEIRCAGGIACALVADISVEADIERLGTLAGDVDILINNAAADEQWAPVLESDLNSWRKTFEVNVFAPIRLLKLFGPGMVSRGRGVVVNISSIGGSHPAPFLATYGVSKSALDTLTRVAAMELAGSGVRVNAIASGITDMGKTYELLPPGLLADIGRIIPAGRLGNGADIGAAVSFLCSDSAEYVNGQIVAVDGAMTAGQWSTNTVMSDSVSVHG